MEPEQGDAPQGQGDASQNQTERASRWCWRWAGSVLAWLSLTPGTTSRLSGVSVPFRLHHFPSTMQVAGPVPTLYGARGGPHVCWPRSCSREGCGCRGLPWLPALSSSSSWLVTTAQGEAPQSSRAKGAGMSDPSRRPCSSGWGGRSLLSRREKGTPVGSSLLLV